MSVGMEEGDFEITFKRWMNAYEVKEGRKKLRKRRELLQTRTQGVSGKFKY